MSEWQWGSNVKTLFTNLKTRYDAKKDANGKWRVTVAVYDPNPAHGCPSHQKSMVYVRFQSTFPGFRGASLYRLYHTLCL